MKKKWKNLRDTYSKFLKSVKSTTGQSAKKNYSNWQWAKHMESFKPFLAYAKTDTNLEPLQVRQLDEAENDLDYNEELSAEPHSGIENEDTGNTTFEFESSRSPTTEKTATPQVQWSKKRKLCDQTSNVDKVVQYLENKRRPTDMDGTELLFLSYAKTLKTFTPRRQATTKMKLAQIFMEQEIEQGEEAAQEYQSTVSPSSTATRFLSPVNTSSDSHSPIIMYASEDTAAHSSSQNMVYENHTAKSLFSTFRPL